MRRTKSDTIQIMRALAIIMVVAQHAIGRVALTNLDFKFMYLLNHIDVPVFLLIAGYLFETNKEKYYKTEIKKYIANKFKNLIVPYLFWSSILVVAVNVIALWRTDLLEKLGLEVWSLSQTVVNILTFKDNYVQHLWFAYIIFFYFIVHYIVRDWLIDGRVLAAIIIVTLLIDLNHIPFICEKFVLHFMDFCIGRCLYKYGVSNIKHKQSYSVIAFAVMLACFASEYYIVDSFTYSYLGYLVYALSGAICVYSVSRYIYFKMEKCATALTMIGDYSFEVYLMHNPYITLLIPMILKARIDNKIFIVIVTVVLGVGLPIIMRKYILQNAMLRKIMFGRS